jgi:hypothetical protein
LSVSFGARLAPENGADYSCRGPNCNDMGYTGQDAATPEQIAGLAGVFTPR